MFNIQSSQFLEIPNLITLFLTYFSTILVCISILFFIFSSAFHGLQNVPPFLYLLTILPFIFGLGAALFSQKLLDKISGSFVYITNVAAILCSIILALYYGIKSLKHNLTVNDITYITYLGIFTSSIYGILSLFILLEIYGSIILQNMVYFFTIIYRNIVGLKTALFNNTEFRNSYVNTFLNFALLFLSIFLFFYFTNYQNANSQTFYFSILGIIGIFLYLFVSTELIKYIFVDHKWSVVILGIIAVLSYAGYDYFAKYASNSTLYTVEYISIIFGILIGIIALAIIFILLKKWFSETNGILGLIINLIFYIPCLVIDIINFIKNEINMTSNIMYILFIIEIILILLYIYIPVVKTKIQNYLATALFPDAMFLDSSKLVGNNDMYKTFKKQVEMSQVFGINKMNVINHTESVYRTNYGFSFWVYINPQKKQPKTLANTSETPIFDFCNKPTFSYINTSENKSDSNGNLVNDKFVIHYTNNEKDAEPTYISLGKQQWHYVFFNYFTDRVELYIDGKLESNLNFGNNLPTYSPNDVVTLGYDNGLYGAICNVKYYADNVTPENISRIYNVLMFSNPPTDT